MRLNECPRCIRGDMSLSWDRYGEYWTCVQCGHHEELQPLVVLSWNPWKDKRRGPFKAR
jgi:Zn ribbon nucleic-acid-binding protein